MADEVLSPPAYPSAANLADIVRRWNGDHYEYCAPSHSGALVHNLIPFGLSLGVRFWPPIFPTFWPLSFARARVPWHLLRIGTCLRHALTRLVHRFA